MRTRDGAGLRLMLGLAALASAGPAVGQSSATASSAPAQISRADDRERSCEQLAAEAAALSQRMGGADSPGVFGRLGDLARSGAQLLPGGALVVAGANVATRPGRERRDAEAETIRNRWHYRNGLYLGRRCEPAPETPHITISETPAVATSASP